METDYSRQAGVFKALCDENRLRIMACLRGGERCACVILEELEIAQSTLSHHMKILCASGLVTVRQQGKWMHYSLSASGCGEAKALLDLILAGTGNHDRPADPRCA